MLYRKLCSNALIAKYLNKKRKRCVVQQAIAILDSGVGGLTVVKEVMRQLPHEKIIYFGDTARAPYGPRTSQEVISFTEQVVKFLTQMNPKMLVIACNTSTAVALDVIRASVNIPVIGVINPGARAAVKKTKTGIVGVIGTEGTIQSGAYEKALHKIFPKIRVYSEACPLFVPLVEQGQYRSAKAEAVVETSLACFRNIPIDCLILGCTHYPFLDRLISNVLGQEIALINSAEETAREVKDVLNNTTSLATDGPDPDHEFFCSGNPIMFGNIAQQWLNRPVNVTQIKWEMNQQIFSFLHRNFS